MAKRIAVKLDAEQVRKVNKIMQQKSLSRYIQERLCELAGVRRPGRKRHPGKKAGLKPNAQGTTLYLDDQATFALSLLQDRPGGFNFRRFVLAEIDNLYNQLK